MKWTQMVLCAGDSISCLEVGPPSVGEVSGVWIVLAPGGFALRRHSLPLSLSHHRCRLSSFARHLLSFAPSLSISTAIDGLPYHNGVQGHVGGRPRDQVQGRLLVPRIPTCSGPLSLLTPNLCDPPYAAGSSSKGIKQ